MEEWQRLADDFIREFDAVDLSAKSKRKSAKATNLKYSQYVVALLSLIHISRHSCQEAVCRNTVPRNVRQRQNVLGRKDSRT